MSRSSPILLQRCVLGTIGVTLVATVWALALPGSKPAEANTPAPSMNMSEVLASAPQHLAAYHDSYGHYGVLDPVRP